jgi:hypothetical protein
MTVYLLTLFYKNLAEHQITVGNIRDEIATIAGKNWRVLSAGEQICAIGFVTDASPETLKSRFCRYGAQHFHFLLVPIAAKIAVFLGEDSVRWLADRLPPD